MKDVAVLLLVFLALDLQQAASRVNDRVDHPLNFWSRARVRTMMLPVA
jgi:hypothetical protein